MEDNALRQAVQHHLAGRLVEAERIYRQILAAEPNHAGAWHLLGAVALQNGRHDDAIDCIGRAIGLDSKHAIFHCNLGEAFRGKGQIDEARNCYEESLRLQPQLAAAHNNLGLVLQAQGFFAEARAHFQEAIRLQADFAAAHFNLSRVLLMEGDFESGWSEYAWRLRIPGHPDQTQRLPRWDGSPLGERPLFLYAEQGLGDTLQFIRLLPIVRTGTSRLTTQVARALVPLLSTSGFPDLLPEGSPIPTTGLQCSLLDLPRLLRIRMETIPATVPYLHADPELVDRWKTELASVDGFKVGIAWQGNPAFYSDQFRSIPLVEFAPLAEIQGVRLVSLQMSDGVQQLSELGGQFAVMTLDPSRDSRVGAFMDTAAIMKNLDLVITSDTVTAHLAGALGVPVWVALPFSPDWRWLLDRDDSPWYPTMRLFRQSQWNRWPDVFSRMAVALDRRVREAFAGLGRSTQ